MDSTSTVSFGAKKSLPGSDGIEIVCPFLLELSPAGGELCQKFEEGNYETVLGTSALFRPTSGLNSHEAAKTMTELSRALQDMLPRLMLHGEPTLSVEFPEPLKRAHQDGFNCLFPASADRNYVEMFVMGFALRLDRLLRLDRTRRVEAPEPSVARKTILSIPSCVTNPEGPTIRWPLRPHAEVHGSRRAA